MRQSTSKVIRVELVEGEQEFSYERPAITNLKLAILIMSTFGLIVGIYALTYMNFHVVMPSKWWKATLLSLIGLEAASFLVFLSSMSSSLVSGGIAVQGKEKCLNVKLWKNRLPEKRLCKPCRIWNDVFIGFRYLCSYWNDRSVDSLSVFHLGDNNLVQLIWVGYALYFF